MARKRTTDGPAPQFFATTAYKQWLWEQIKRRGWTLETVVEKIKRAGSSWTTSGLSQFLGPENEIPAPSNTSLMPTINKVFGIAPPPVCDPTDEISQLRDLLADRWARLTPREKRLLLELLADGGDA